MKRFNYLIALAFYSASMLVHSSELLISPVNLDIPAGAKSTVLRIKNLSQIEMILQVRVQPWEKQSKNFRDVVISPAMLRIPPQREQIVRVVNTGAPAQLDIERMYRVIIDDLAPPNSLLKEQPSAIGLKMRYALPLFIGGPNLMTSRTNDTKKLKQAWQQQLQFSLVGERQIRFLNQANLHARIAKLTIHYNEESYSVVPGLLGYVQPKTSQTFPLAQDIPVGAALSAEVNGVVITLPQVGTSHD